jgi:hypothetical protein
MSSTSCPTCSSCAVRVMPFRQRSRVHRLSRASVIAAVGARTAHRARQPLGGTCRASIPSSGRLNGEVFYSLAEAKTSSRRRQHYPAPHSASAKPPVPPACFGRKRHVHQPAAKPACINRRATEWGQSTSRLWITQSHAWVALSGVWARRANTLLGRCCMELSGVGPPLPRSQAI